MTPPESAVRRALDLSARNHARLCPRQVLGVRIALEGGTLLGLEFPRTDKRVLALVETDGCAIDGVAAASGCSVGRRTMRVIDYGKVAATFVDTVTEEVVRVAASPGARDEAARWAPDEPSRWHAQLAAYQVMPADHLLRWERVALAGDVRKLVSRPGVRTSCDACGEEILNERELRLGGQILCAACGGQPYYQRPPAELLLPTASRGSPDGATAAGLTLQVPNPAQTT